MGLFNWKKKEIQKEDPVVKTTIQQELMDYVDIYGDPKAVDDYINKTVRPAFGSRTDYDKTKAVLGVITMAERDKKLALAKYDTLIKWWLDLDEQSDEAPKADMEIAFYDGLLEANNVVSKQDFGAFHQKNMNMANEMSDRKISRLRGKI